MLKSGLEVCLGKGTLQDDGLHHIAGKASGIYSSKYKYIQLTFISIRLLLKTILVESGSLLLLAHIRNCILT